MKAGKRIIKAAREAVKVAQCNHALVDRSTNPWRCPTCGAKIHNPPQVLK